MATTKKRSPRKRRKKPNWNSRYAENWATICAIAHRATGNKCCCCWVAESKEVHHVRYEDRRGAIKGREVAGRDVFPVCGSTNEPGTCHHRLHLSDAWVYDEADPLLGNHQRSEWVKKLKLGYQLLSARSRG